jgi:hypothetical protein
MDPMPPSPTQEEIDAALRRRVLVSQATAARPRQAQLLRLALYALGGAGVVVTALFHFWFNAVSDLPMRYTPRWHEEVSAHMKEADGGFVRLGAVESEVGSLRASVKELRLEFGEMRRDQLEFYRWQADRAGDQRRAQALAQRLKQVR